jgi:uncharacterized protein involved in exopolysaccharide biosynthesis
MDSNESQNTPSTTPPSAQPIYLMYPPELDDSIDFMEVFAALWRWKLLIAGITFLFAAGGVGYALTAEPVFRVEVVLAANEPEQGPNIPSSLGGVASLVGIDLGSASSSNTALALATLRSRIFVEDFIVEEGLLPVLFADKWDAATQRWIGDDLEEIPDVRDAVALFREKIRSITEDANTGLITLAIEWKDPEIAAAWANELVSRINEQLRTKDLENSERRLAILNDLLSKSSLVPIKETISRVMEQEYQTIMLARTETEYAFKIIDPPRIPKERVAPRRRVIVMVAALMGSFVGVFFALLLRWIRGHRRAILSR